MVRFGRLHSLLIFAALGAAALVMLCVVGPPLPGRLLLTALAGWGLLSLPAGLLVGHYCALGDEPAR